MSLSENSDSAWSQSRLEALRSELRADGLAAIIVARGDEYLGEYLPPHNERLRWCSGFTGSAGVAVISQSGAAIFVDGRYTVQVRQQVDGDSFSYLPFNQQALVDYLQQEISKGEQVACDLRTHSQSWYQQLQSSLENAGIDLVASDGNLIDRVWHDRPEAQVKPVHLLAEQFTGEHSLSKRRRIGDKIAQAGADAALIFATDSVSWLLNVRGCDVPMLPVMQSFAVLEASGDLALVVNANRIPEGFNAHVGEGVSLYSLAQTEELLQKFSQRAVLADAQTSNAWIFAQLAAAGVKTVAGADPVLIPKASKNAVELAGARAAHLRDGVAVVRFLHWLDTAVAAQRWHCEAELADKLDALRAEGENYRDKSFDTISAAGPNAALCHYNHQHALPASLTANSVYLVDSGGQYLDGTTDITRTTAIGEVSAETKRLFTLVLKGHIALATACFPVGTTGTHLDVLARQYLWQAGCDYSHGTGHGVGAYLSVHEGPQRIAPAWNDIALAPGMIVSNEPGYYREGEFGIRCENLVAVVPCDDASFECPMLRFETLSLAPFDHRLIDTSLLSADELAWLNQYHATVAKSLAPKLDGAALDWLMAATAPLRHDSPARLG